jgi:hypothetical protein
LPYKSEKQRKFFNANREKLEAQGVDVDEWNASTKGKKLPKTAQDSFVPGQLPPDIKPVGSYESLKAKMDRIETEKPLYAPMNKNLWAGPSQTPDNQIKAASVLASLLYLNRHG